MPTRLQTEPAITDAPGIAPVVGVAVKTIRKWTSEQRIPYIRLSPRCVRYNVADVRAWMEERTVKPLNS